MEDGMARPAMRVLNGSATMVRAQEEGPGARLQLNIQGAGAVLLLYRIGWRKSEQVLGAARRAGLHPYQPQATAEPRGAPVPKPRPGSNTAIVASVDLSDGIEKTLKMLMVASEQSENVDTAQIHLATLDVKSSDSSNELFLIHRIESFRPV